MQLLDNEDRRLSDPEEIRKTEGVQAYLQALASRPVQLPTYWTVHHTAAGAKDSHDSKPHSILLSVFR